MLRWGGELRDPSQAEQVVEWIVWALAGKPERFDWNQQNFYKPFAADRLAIELTTQRGHVVRVERGADLAMVDTGRRSGEALAFVRSAGTPPGDASLWRGWAERLGALAASVTHAPSAAAAECAPDRRGLGVGVWEWSPSAGWVRGATPVGEAWERSCWAHCAWGPSPDPEVVARLRSLSVQ